MRRLLIVSATVAAVLSLVASAVLFVDHASASPNPQSNEVLHGAHIMLTRGNARPGGGSSPLLYNGGNPAVETGSDLVYLVYWGSQWGTNGSNDPSGEAAIQQSFFTGVGGSHWNGSVTQYCQSNGAVTVATGASTCPSGATFAVNPNTTLLGNVWFDSASAAPSKPTQTQLANEAIRAAAHFGNTTADSNTHVQYVINTATGNNASGFGTRYCAWHSSVASGGVTYAYTNMPYITDAGASCGANFNGLGPTAGITIVGGHEFAETETDIYPNGGWLDSGGAENGDKCAWITSGNPGASQDITLSTGTFAVQSLWSNSANGCVV